MNSDTKFTPGPWELGRDLALYVSVRKSWQGGGQNIALVCRLEGRNKYERATRNARLIAASPDLFAALEGLVNATLYEVKCQRLDLARVDAEIVAAIDALTKARGEVGA